MAAIDLTAADTTPWGVTTASVGTTWQEYQLPSWCRVVTVKGDAALYVAWDKMGLPSGTPEEPADGGAVGTHRYPVAANAALAVPIRDHSRDEATASIFVAAQSGTATVNLVVQRATGA